MTLDKARRRERLDPDVFRLPVDRIREGYYTDAYFNLTKELLVATGRHPRVMMQVFQRQRSVLGGIDEALAILKLCSGRLRGRRMAAWLGRADRSRAARGRRGLAVRDRDAHRGRLLAVRASRDGLPRLARASYLDHAKRPGRGRGGGGKPILYFPARHDHWLVQTGDGWAAHVAGAIGVSTDAQASWWGGRGIGTVPHALIACFDGDTVAAARAFADHFAGETNIVVLVDFENDSVRTSLEVADALGERLWGVRLDTSHTIVDQALLGQMGSFDPRGVNPELVRLVRAALDEAGHGGVRIVVSGGFNAERIREFERERVPVDAYGVGSSLIRGENDFTADVVMVEGVARSKVGRRYSPNDRLELVT